MIVTFCGHAHFFESEEYEQDDNFWKKSKKLRKILKIPKTY